MTIQRGHLNSENGPINKREIEMKTPTFAPDIKVGQKVKILFNNPISSDFNNVYEIGSINSKRTKALLRGFWHEFLPDELVILRGELKEFKDVN